jgi:hypothetical protein
MDEKQREQQLRELSRLVGRALAERWMQVLEQKGKTAGTGPGFPRLGRGGRRRGSSQRRARGDDSAADH